MYGAGVAPLIQPKLIGSPSLGAPAVLLLLSTRSLHSRLLPTFAALAPILFIRLCIGDCHIPLACIFWSCAWIARDAWKSVEEQTRERQSAASLLLELR